MIQTVVDTNFLLRLVLGDIPAQTRAAVAHLSDLRLRGREAYVAAATISEVVFVLRGQVYRRTREQISHALNEILWISAFAVGDAQVVRRAVTLYRDHHDDWDDCLVAAYALEHAGGRVASFDKGLDGIPGLTRAAPATGA
ncbi:MAG TPA: PIN domain-containing protein [Tepidiformaceae bacterium]|nr:PIN domain-containing protein [Tepidiformaceae bacterium]